jgi:glutaredoxin
VSSGGPPIVTLYISPGCHLCDRARDVLAEARDEIGFGLVEVDIAGDPELEARYREWLPVVEIDGRRRFTYFVQPEPFRRAVAQPTAEG